MLPAAGANMTPPLIRNLPILSTPVDFGCTLRGRRITGDNKTYRGLFGGILIAIIIAYLQKIFYNQMFEYSLIDYSKANFITLGILLGGGALLGDVLKSFIKRQLDIQPGNNWIPFDQIDWVLGAMILVSFYAELSIYTVIGILLLFGILHPIVNYIGFLIGVRK